MKITSPLLLLVVVMMFGSLLIPSRASAVEPYYFQTAGFACSPASNGGLGWTTFSYGSVGGACGGAETVCTSKSDSNNPNYVQKVTFSSDAQKTSVSEVHTGDTVFCQGGKQVRVACGDLYAVDKIPPVAGQDIKSGNYCPDVARPEGPAENCKFISSDGGGAVNLSKDYLENNTGHMCCSDFSRRYIPIPEKKAMAHMQVCCRAGRQECTPVIGYTSGFLGGKTDTKLNRMSSTCAYYETDSDVSVYVPQIKGGVEVSLRGRCNDGVKHELFGNTILSRAKTFLDADAPSAGLWVMLGNGSEPHLTYNKFPGLAEFFSKVRVKLLAFVGSLSGRIELGDGLAVEKIDACQFDLYRNGVKQTRPLYYKNDSLFVPGHIISGQEFYFNSVIDSYPEEGGDSTAPAVKNLLRFTYSDVVLTAGRVAYYWNGIIWRTYFLDNELHAGYLNAYRIIRGLADKTQCGSSFTSPMTYFDQLAETLVDLDLKIDSPNGEIQYEIENDFMVSTSSEIVTLPAGSDIVLRAKPINDYKVLWSGACANNTLEDCDVALFSDQTVNANFLSKTAVTGLCGSASGVPATAAPAQNLCSAGTASAVTLSGTAWNWTCEGSSGGTAATCSSPKTTTFINGLCGSASGSATAPYAPTTNLCSVGTATSPVKSGDVWTWACNGSGGGLSLSCATVAKLGVSGSCGSANGTTVSYAPTRNLCSVGYNSAVTYYSTPTPHYGWSCIGSNGGATATCSANKQTTTAPVSGTCGSANGRVTLIAPASNLCSAGTASSVSPSGSSWTWMCAGSNGGTNASCSAPKTMTTTATNGACGSANNTTVSGTPTTNLCSSGTNSNPTYYATPTPHYGWGCVGLNGGTTATCSATKSGAITGVCGSAISNPPSYDPPATNLCSVGSASSVSLSATGKWVWKCAGTNGGGTASCYSPRLVLTNGTCGSSNGQTLNSAPTSNLCSAGNASSVTTGTNYTWSCAGTNGGTTASCSANKTATPSPSANDFSKLEIRPITSQPANGAMIAGQSVSIYTGIRNMGTEAVMNVPVVWTLDGQTVQSRTMPGLNPSTAWTSLSYLIPSITAGAHTFTIQVTGGPSVNYNFTVPAPSAFSIFEPFAAILRAFMR